MLSPSRAARRLLQAAVCVSAVIGCTTGCATARPGIPIVPLADGRREMPREEQMRHALSRLTFGPEAADWREIRHLGVDRWIGEQLTPAAIDDSAADTFIQRYPLLSEDETSLAQIYALPGDLRRRGGTTPDTAAIRLADRRSADVINELRAARVARAVLTRRQLLEEMVDFWENHFSIYADKGADRYMLVDFDREIRSHALGRFRDLLGVVAHSPAMLFYLDNWQSRADSDQVTLADVEGARKAAEAEVKFERMRTRLVTDSTGHTTIGDPNARPPAPFRPSVRHGRGLNENYGRELMELHTLGVNGGYTQQDVIEAARILTGWTIRDPNHVGTFTFNPSTHDAGEKVVLGEHFPAGHGEDEGERLLDLLARSPATARFISRKLCERFVSDSPSTALVDRAAQTYLRTDGDIAEVMRTILASPEFWARADYHAKIKSPFEVVVSTLRALGGTPDTLARDAQAVAQLGEPIFGHIDPNGYPETGEEWMNTGALLNRINFGMRAALGQLPMVSARAWTAATRLARLPGEAQVDTLVVLLLGGDASPTTRRVLEQGAGARAPEPPAQATSDFVQLVGLALGTPEFQRR